MRTDLFIMAGNIDPTRTTMVRKAYEREMVKRFRSLKRDIIDSILESDVEEDTLATNAKRKFKFDRKGKKVGEFMDWIRSEEYKRILGTTYGTPMTKAAETSWQNVYLKTSYQKGIASAGAQLRKGGAKVEDSWINEAFNRPVHADRAGIIYTRAYSDLEGITREMDKQISRTLATGIAEGRGVKELAKQLADRIDKVGITRARTLARTEVISAHAEASLNSYEEAGVEGVSVQSEFVTAQDNKVCPKCEALEGRVYSMKSARGVIPVHPNCRCAWLPVVDVGRNITLR